MKTLADCDVRALKRGQNRLHKQSGVNQVWQFVLFVLARSPVPFPTAPRERMRSEAAQDAVPADIKSRASKCGATSPVGAQYAGIRQIQFISTSEGCVSAQIQGSGSGRAKCFQGVGKFVK